MSRASRRHDGTDYLVRRIQLALDVRRAIRERLPQKDRHFHEVQDFVGRGAVDEVVQEAVAVPAAVETRSVGCFGRASQRASTAP